MIDRREILDLAATFGLPPNVVEKDYVLGWLLWGIYNQPELADNWVFKGGTCLKKGHGRDPGSLGLGSCREDRGPCGRITGACVFTIIVISGGILFTHRRIERYIETLRRF